MLPPVEYRVVVKTLNADGSVLKRYAHTTTNSSRPICCFPDGPGGAYVSIRERQWSMFHITVLWSYMMWIKWHWNLSGPGLENRVQLVNKGWDIDHDPPWSWDGTIHKKAYYYQYCCGDSRSGYYMMKQGSFSGPALGNYDAHCYPKLYLWVTTDGSVRYDSVHGC
jgi:hypothetical protein